MNRYDVLAKQPPDNRMKDMNTTINRREPRKSRPGIILVAILLVIAVIQRVTSSKSFGGEHNQFEIFDGPKNDETNENRQLNQAQFHWDSIIPSEDLVYTPCYDALQCARLLVPMDWNSSVPVHKGNSVAIAIVKRPADVSLLDPRYGGEIYINPGGPGSSGVDFLSQNGVAIQQLFEDLTDAGKIVYDLVAFDPRGVVHSTPRMSCFSNLIERQVWSRQNDNQPLIGTTEAELGLRFAYFKSFSRVCNGDVDKSNEESNDKIQYHISTANVVRDMIEILEKSGQLREKNARKAAMQLGIKPTAEAWEKLQYHKDDEKLQYWGFSYGSILGITFASMYPSRIHRLAVDGVGDTDEYRAGVWNTHLTQTDSSLKLFYEFCYSAGPERCPMYDSEGPDVIEKSVQQILADLKKAPIPIWNQNIPQVLTYSNVIGQLFGLLFKPIRDFPIMASYLAMIRDGDYKGLSKMLETAPILGSEIECQGETCLEPNVWYLEANIAITCSDGDDFRQDTMEDLENSYRQLQKHSELFAGVMADPRVHCASWNIRPKWRYSGPFSRNTSHPILFIGNKLDPVSAYQNAFKMSEQFPGSRVLVQDSGGHCSLSFPSECVAQHVRNYFNIGSLPPNGTVCPVDKTPFS